MTTRLRRAHAAARARAGTRRARRLDLLRNFLDSQRKFASRRTGMGLPFLEWSRVDNGNALATIYLQIHQGAGSHSEWCPTLGHRMFFQLCKDSLFHLNGSLV